MIDGVEAGHRLGFFMVQDAADETERFAQADAFEFVDGSGAPANVYSGSDLYIAVDGEAQLELTIFHSFDSSLNPDGIEHVVSGATSDGTGLILAMEDLTGGGDLDFEDVVFQVDLVV